MSRRFDRQHASDWLAQHQLVPVVRASSPDMMLELTQALVAGGIRCVEITFSVPKALDVIAMLSNHFGSSLLLGAGTVLDASMTQSAIDAGADFIVSPITRPEIAQTARRRGVLGMLGAFTPTEVLTAWEAGSDVVKIFPADAVGPGYLKAIHGPLPHIPLMPTGGVTLETLTAFRQAGAFCLGVGSALVSRTLVENNDWPALTALAQQFVAGLEK